MAVAAATADLPTPPFPETMTSLGPSAMSVPAGEWDAEDQVPVLHRPGGMGDQGVVGEVGFGPGDGPGALAAGVLIGAVMLE